MKWLAPAVGALLCATAIADDRDDSSAQRFYDSATPPVTVAQILERSEALIDARLFARDDFYTEAHLRLLFGNQEKVEILELPSQTRGTIHGFTELVSRPTEDQNVRYLDGIWVEARKGRASAWSFCCDFSVTFWGALDGLDFLSVTRALGANWKRDRESETARFLSQTMEAFNPPFPTATGYMGNAIIVYKTASGVDMHLDFNPDGTLHEITASLPKTNSPLPQAPGHAEVPR